MWNLGIIFCHILMGKLYGCRGELLICHTLSQWHVWSPILPTQARLLSKRARCPSKRRKVWRQFFAPITRKASSTRYASNQSFSVQNTGHMLVPPLSMWSGYDNGNWGSDRAVGTQTISCFFLLFDRIVHGLQYTWRSHYYQGYLYRARSLNAANALQSQLHVK